MIDVCVVCHTQSTQGTTFTLTPEERQAIPGAPETVHYCKACLRVMKDREAGAQLLKGAYEMKLRELGVPRATEIAEQFHVKLLRATTKKMH